MTIATPTFPDLPVAPAATVVPAVAAVASTVDAVLATPAVQALDAAVVTAAAPKIPAAVRNALYETAKWAGLIGLAATSTAGLLTGKTALYVGTAGFVLVSLTALLAKANVTKP